MGRQSSVLLIGDYDSMESIDELDETREPVVDGVLQDFPVEFRVLVGEHVAHADDPRPFRRCFGLEYVRADLADGVDGDFQPMAHGVADQGVVE